MLFRSTINPSLDQPKYAANLMILVCERCQVSGLFLPEGEKESVFWLQSVSLMDEAQAGEKL